MLDIDYPGHPHDKERNWHDDFELYRIQILDFNDDSRKIYYCVTKDFETALKFAKEYFFEDRYDLCGVWEMPGMVITQTREKINAGIN